MNSPLQFGFETILFIIPLLICCLLMSRRPEGRGIGVPSDSEIWFIPKSITETYHMIENLIEEWKKEKEPPAKPSYVSIFSPRSPTAFRAIEEISPRLLKLSSRSEGQVTFELTEVQGSGTSVKASFSHEAGSRVQTLKAQLPLKAHGMKACAVCERLLLPDFIHCPYCGHKQENMS